MATTCRWRWSRSKRSPDRGATAVSATPRRVAALPPAPVILLRACACCRTWPGALRVVAGIPGPPPGACRTAPDAAALGWARRPPSAWIQPDARALQARRLRLRLRQALTPAAGSLHSRPLWTGVSAGWTGDPARRSAAAAAPAAAVRPFAAARHRPVHGCRAAAARALADALPAPGSDNRSPGSEAGRQARPHGGAARWRLDARRSAAAARTRRRWRRWGAGRV